MPDLEKNARKYAADRSRIIKSSLGHGTDGSVWSTHLDTAIKAFERQRNYAHELACYQRLKDKAVSEIAGFAVPSLVDSSDELLIVEMDIVSPPCVLDFGKAFVDIMPPHYNDLWREELATFEDMFDDNADKARLIVFTLQQIGIYYFDAKPNNIKFD